MNAVLPPLPPTPCASPPHGFSSSRAIGYVQGMPNPPGAENYRCPFSPETRRAEWEEARAKLGGDSLTVEVGSPEEKKLAKLHRMEDVKVSEDCLMALEQLKLDGRKEEKEDEEWMEVEEDQRTEEDKGERLLDAEGMDEIYAQLTTAQGMGPPNKLDVNQKKEESKNDGAGDGVQPALLEENAKVRI